MQRPANARPRSMPASRYIGPRTTAVRVRKRRYAAVLADARVRSSVAFAALGRPSLADRGGGPTPPSAGVELLALSDHDTVDGVDEALQAGRRARRARRARDRDLRRRRRSTRTCTCSATGSTTTIRVLARAACGRPRRPRAPRRRDGGEAARARLRGRSRADRGAQGRRQAGRPAAPRRRRRRPPGERRAARGRGPDRRLVVHPRVPDPGHVGLRRAHPPDGRRGDRVDPRGRRRRGLGAPVLGHQGRAARCSPRSTATARSGSTASRSSTRPTRPSRSTLLADRCGELGLLTTGSADFHGPEHRLFSSFRAFDLHGHTPELGPIAAGVSGGSASNGHRARPLPLADRPLGRGQVDDRAARSSASCASRATASRCSTATSCAAT